MTKEEYYKIHKKEYDEINRILDENDEKADKEIKENKNLIPFADDNYWDHTNWHYTVFTPEEIKKLKKKFISVTDIINKYAKEK